MSVATLAAILELHAPYRPHAVIGVLGDGSTGVLRLHFTDPTTEAEVAHVVDVLTKYLPLPVVLEPVWTQRVRLDLPHPFLGFRIARPL